MIPVGLIDCYSYCIYSLMIYACKMYAYNMFVKLPISSLTLADLLTYLLTLTYITLIYIGSHIYILLLSVYCLVIQISYIYGMSHVVTTTSRLGACTVCR